MDLSSLWENRVESKRIGMTGQENTGNFKGPQRWATLCGVNMTSGKVSVIESLKCYNQVHIVPILWYLRWAKPFDQVPVPSLIIISYHIVILSLSIFAWVSSLTLLNSLLCRFNESFSKKIILCVIFFPQRYKKFLIFRWNLVAAKVERSRVKVNLFQNLLNILFKK